jgi:hypothetical protein
VRIPLPSVAVAIRFIDYVIYPHRIVNVAETEAGLVRVCKLVEGTRPTGSG